MPRPAVRVLFIMLVVPLGVVPGSPVNAQNVASAAVPQGSQVATQNSAHPPGEQNSASSESGQGEAASRGELPANTELRATLDTPLSTKTSKPGDRFTATVSQPISGSTGIVIPAGSRVEGEVSDTDQAKSATVLHGKETLNLHFRDIVLPNGQTIPLVSSLVSVNTTNGSATQRKAVTSDAGTGETSPATLGWEPLKGLAIGSLSGGGYVLATNGKQQVNLPARTGIVIRLDQQFKLE